MENNIVKEKEIAITNGDEMSDMDRRGEIVQKKAEAYDILVRIEQHQLAVQELQQNLQAKNAEIAAIL